MRIYLGGGNHRGRGPRIGVYIPLGPVGNIIVGTMVSFVGLVAALMSFGAIMPLIVGLVFIAVGVSAIVKGSRMIKAKHDRLD